MRFGVPPFLTVFFCLFIHITFAIYADEAYQLDYHHALVGLPQAHTTFFHRPSISSKASLLYTLSKDGIIGAINPKDGTVLWRQSIGKQDRNYTGEDFLKTEEGSDTIYSAVDGRLQAWDAVDGRLSWEWQGSGSVKALNVQIGAGVENWVLMLSEEDGSHGTVRCFSADNGEIIWDFKDTSGDIPFSLVSARGSIFYISLHSAILKGFKIQVTEIDPANGKRKGQKHGFNSENEVTSADSIVFAGAVAKVPTVIWSDKSFKFVKVLSLSKKQTTTLGALSDTGESPEGIEVHAPSTSGSKPHLLLHLKGRQSHWAKVYHIDHITEAVAKAYDLPGVPGKGWFSETVQGSNVYFVRHSLSSVSLVSSTSSDFLQDWPVPPRPHGGVTDLREISHAAAEVVSRGGTKFSIRSVLALTTGDWELVRNGESVWVRPEGLSEIEAATFVDNPAGEDLAQELAVEGQYNPVSAYLHRLRRHIKELQYLPGFLHDQYVSLNAALHGEDVSGGIMRVRRDKFGFNKIVIVATKHGRVAAFDTAYHGRVLWSIQAVKLGPGEIWDVLSIETEEGSAIVRAAKGEFLCVETSSGKIIHYQKGSLLDGLYTSVPVTNAYGRQTPVPIHADGIPGEIPKADFGDGIVLVTKGSGTVRGWNLSTGRKPSLAWQFVPFSGEAVVQVKHRPGRDPVASIGKALGDRNVLYKYLNPNLLLVTATNAVTSTATFYLVDSVSGATLYSMTHSDVDLSQPISSSIFENFLAYSLFSTITSQDPLQLDQQKLKSHQLVVSELFESPFPNDRGPLGPSPNFSSRQPNFSTEPPAEYPHVISQTFLTPSPISHMSTTSTLQGITPRSLLCVVPPMNNIFSIPLYLLDSRRPVGRDPTSAEAEEGLVRYHAILDFDPKWSLNHKREFLGLSDVITSPSLLESTSLIFAFGGHDIFGTRVSPIGGFDLLGKGFSKFQLVATVTALALGTTILAPMVRFSPFLCYLYLTLGCGEKPKTDQHVVCQVRKKQINSRWKS